ncbi:hypothetical protein BJ322DRAFT_1105220 [Thelephora terrestris]|uniref:F-box domain-containing protein n=1 Tax=Thelephora terrestris TaxID=56493 RepID=A0A9P6LA03_9AGAM|nr:hypothetical protein BJ322DRAFT_1105220 [Thelephora terrestris]
MSIYCPPEILDHIVDILHDEPEALRQCCLVSKSWVPRSRKHLFVVIKFHAPSDLGAWKRTFPDPSNSPAHHTRTLFIGCPEVVTEEDAAEGGWIQAFSCVTRLETVDNFEFSSVNLSLIPFHKISSTLKSLHVSHYLLSLSQLSYLIQSSPLLEDLTLIGYDTTNDDDELDESQTAISPSITPALSGTLEIFVCLGISRTVRRLLDLPNGLQFQKLKLTSWGGGDSHSIVGLMEACFDTLECLDIAFDLDDQTPIDLSKITKLKDVVFRCKSLSGGWILMALETITVKHRDLQQISIHVPFLWDLAALKDHASAQKRIHFFNPGAKWSFVDGLLASLWESRSVHLKIVYPRPETLDEGREMQDLAGFLFPETTRRGIADFVEESLDLSQICDNIVDLLHDDHKSLKQCCLVSKLWVSRTRKHLFAYVSFRIPTDLEAWKKTFPDPPNSPAHFTQALWIGCLKAVLQADAAGGGWISTFSRVARLEVLSYANSDLGVDLTLFQRFSSTLKSLCVTSSRPLQIINHIYRFPLLEDLTLCGYDQGPGVPQTTNPLSASPALTGTLELRLTRGISGVAHQLLGLPNGLHFRRLKLPSSNVGDLSPVAKLVDACSNTLEYLDVQCKKPAGRTLCLINLSKARKLKEVVFGCEFLDIKWVTVSLKTAAKLRNLQKITIHAPSVLFSASLTNVGVNWGEDEQARTLWSELDPLLVRFGESRSIRTKIIYPPPDPDDEGRGADEWPEYLLPESMKRGVIDLAQKPSD